MQCFHTGLTLTWGLGSGFELICSLNSQGNPRILCSVINNIDNELKQHQKEEEIRMTATTPSWGTLGLCVWTVGLQARSAESARGSVDSTPRSASAVV